MKEQVTMVDTARRRNGMRRPVRPAARLLMTALMALGFAGVSASATEPPPKIPLEDFFRNPESAGYELSPDGKWLGFMKPYKNRLNIFVRALGSDREMQVTSETDRDISGFFWKGNDHVLYLKDFGGDENFHLFSAGLNGKGAKDLTPFDGVRVQIIDDLKDQSKTDILVGLNKRNPQIFDVYRLNVVTGDIRMIAENPGNYGGWMTDHEGRLRVARATDGVNSTLLYRETEDDEFRAVMTSNFKEGVNPLFFTFDNRHVYAVSNVGRDKDAIIRFDIAKGKELDVIYEHPEVDVARLFYSPKRKVLVGVAYQTWKWERKYLDAQAEQRAGKLEAKLPGYEVSLASSNDDETLWVVAAYSDRSRGTYYLYDAPKDKLTKLGEAAPWLDESKLASMKPITYTSRDGLTIHGYLTLPVGQNPKNLPVVVNPHGGPWARDSWGFNPEVQFFANRGYAVLQMNFRGSIGYGRKFWEASFREWGKTMQNDITDGVKWLIDEGIADPDRVAIYGASYGGYATLAGLTFTPDVYACGIDYVGVSNLFTFMESIPPYWKPYKEMMYEMVGNPEKDSALFRSASPVFHVDNIKAPLMVLQGAKDPRVNINESDQIVEALKNRGVDVEYIVKENEGHGFHNEENRMEAYAAMERFLAKHLGTAAAYSR